MGIYEGGGDAILRQGVGKQIVAAAVNGLLGYNVVTLLCQRLNGVGNRCRAGGSRQGGDTALQRCNALFQHILRRIRQTTVDIAGICQSKPGSGMGGISKHIGSGLVNGYRAGIGSGVGLFLTNVELQSFKFIVRHRSYLFRFSFRAENKNARAGEPTPGQDMASGFLKSPGAQHNTQPSSQPGSSAFVQNGSCF